MRPLTRARARTRPAPTDGALIAELIDVRKRFEDKEVLRGVSLSVQRGETMVIMGGSGSGKTVTLRCMAGLIRPTSGEVLVFGERIDALSEEALLPIRRRMGYVFQGAALFDSLTVHENVAYPLREHTSLARRRSASVSCTSCPWWVSAPRCCGCCPPSYRAACASGSASPARWPRSPRCCSSTSPPLASTRRTRGWWPISSFSSGRRVRYGGRRDARPRADQDRCRPGAVLVDGRFAALGPRDEVLASTEPAVQAFLAGEARMTT
jgi:ABC-type sugar transport system ATPase subunit